MALFAFRVKLMVSEEAVAVAGARYKCLQRHTVTGVVINFVVKAHADLIFVLISSLGIDMQDCTLCLHNCTICFNMHSLARSEASQALASHGVHR